MSRGLGDVYKRQVLAILRAGREPGKASVTVTSPGREDARIELEITGA